MYLNPGLAGSRIPRGAHPFPAIATLLFFDRLRMLSKNSSKLTSATLFGKGSWPLRPVLKGHDFNRAKSTLKRSSALAAEERLSANLTQIWASPQPEKPIRAKPLVQAVNSIEGPTS
jgi:hypothetical protein